MAKNKLNKSVIDSGVKTTIETDICLTEMVTLVATEMNAYFKAGVEFQMYGKTAVKLINAGLATLKK